MKLRVLKLQQRVLDNRKAREDRAVRFWDRRLVRRESWFKNELKIRRFVKCGQSISYYHYDDQSFEDPGQNGFHVVQMERRGREGKKSKPAYIFRLGGFRIALAVPYGYDNEYDYFVFFDGRFVSITRPSLLKVLARTKKIEGVE